MSSATGIRIDSLLHSLKELQNEKQCLEQKLNERKCRAQALERRVENCNAKVTQMREMHQKLSDAKSSCAEGISNTAASGQSPRAEPSTEQQDQRAEQPDSAGKDRGLKNVEEFQDKMSALSQKLITARKFYKTETLQERIEETSDKIKSNEFAAKLDSEEVDSLSSTMGNLQLTPTSRAWDQDVPHDIRVLIWTMLEEEESQVKASLQRLQAEQQEICAFLQESTSTHTHTHTHSQPTCTSAPASQ